MRAIVTAGGRVDGEFEALLGTPVKALASIRGRTMLHATIEAARGAGASWVGVVGGEEIARSSTAGAADAIVPESASGGENVLRALDAWNDGEPLLYLTSDMPYLTAEALRSFIDRVPFGALAMPVTEEEDFVRRFPQPPAHGIRLDGEYVTNGGAFWLPAGSRDAVRAMAVRFFDARKSVWQMASLLGFRLLMRFALRRLSIGDLEAHAHALLGLRTVAVRGCAAELAYDIDTLEEYRYAIAQR